MKRTPFPRLRSNKASDNKMVSLSPKASKMGHNERNTYSSKMGKISEDDVAITVREPLEISDDGAPWKNMAVRSSDESPIDFLMTKRGLLIIAFSLIAFIVVLFALFDHGYYISHTTSGNENTNSDDDLVAPIKGQAYLTTDEFRDIRKAHPEESVLITGGLGFIGSHVTDLLLHRGFKVTILDDESNGHNHNKFAKEIVPHDITVVGDLPAFPTGDSNSEDKNAGYYTHVIHLAAAISVAESMNDPDKYERVNYGGSQKVLDWVQSYNHHISSQDDNLFIRKVVAASSAAIYGDPDPALLPLQEDTPYGGKSPYADTKYRMEGLMRDFVEMQNAASNDSSAPPTSAVALRFFNVYGPRQDPKNPYSGVISLFLEAAMNGMDITILGDGEMTRDFVYVKDVARAIVLSLLKEEDSDATFNVFNVCTGKTITINTLAEHVIKSMESHSEIAHLDPRNGDIRASSCNPNGAKGGIGFVSAVSQEGGLEKTSNWFRLENEK